jgi:hypothetical protein
MKVVIAEKPCCSGDCSLLGATEKKEGYLMGNGYQVTCVRAFSAFSYAGRLWN